MASAGDRPVGPRVARLRRRRRRRRLALGLTLAAVGGAGVVFAEVTADPPPDLRPTARRSTPAVSTPPSPPPTSSAPDSPTPSAGTRPARVLLRAADLPPVRGIQASWVATAGPGRTVPLGTPCDRFRSHAEPLRAVGRRVFTIPRSTRLPTPYGVDEAVVAGADREAATDVRRAVYTDVSRCERRRLGTAVRRVSDLSARPLRGRTWVFGFEVAPERVARFRVGLVASRDRVAYLSMPLGAPFGLSDQAFSALVARAGRRLATGARWPRPRRRPAGTVPGCAPT